MNWYVVRVKSRQEKLAETNLKRVGVETFLPLLNQNRLVGRRQLERVVPLFPGYLFARFDLNSQHRAVNFAQGVCRVVSFGSEVPRVDDQMIESLQSRVRNGCITVPPSSFTPGQTVRISHGPFQGIDVVFEREMSDQQRVIVLLQTLTFQAHLALDVREVVNL